MADRASEGLQVVWGRLPTILDPTDRVVKPVYKAEARGRLG